jgi:large subunit ribosomal protein L11
MVSEKTISALVDGGKATPGPPIGPALGPLGVNAAKVVMEINQKTKAFEGTTVPVKIIVNPETKEYRIEVGTPSVPAMLKKELYLERGSGKAKLQKVGEITIDQVIKIAHAKSETTLAKTEKKHVKEVIGTCITMGILIGGKSPQEAQKDVDSGMYDMKIEGKTPLELPTKAQIDEMKKKYVIVEVPKEEEKKPAAAATPAVPEKPAVIKKDKLGKRIN